jgi:hypothetical protein
VLIDDADETWRIAARRTIETFRTACGDDDERRRLDQLAVLRRDRSVSLNRAGP